MDDYTKKTLDEAIELQETQEKYFDEFDKVTNSSEIRNAMAKSQNTHQEIEEKIKYREKRTIEDYGEWIKLTNPTRDEKINYWVEVFSGLYALGFDKKIIMECESSDFYNEVIERLDKKSKDRQEEKIQEQEKAQKNPLIQFKEYLKDLEKYCICDNESINLTLNQRRELTEIKEQYDKINSEVNELSSGNFTRLFSHKKNELEDRKSKMKAISKRFVELVTIYQQNNREQLKRKLIDLLNETYKGSDDEVQAEMISAVLDFKDEMQRKYELNNENIPKDLAFKLDNGTSLNDIAISEYYPIKSYDDLINTRKKIENSISKKNRIADAIKIANNLVTTFTSHNSNELQEMLTEEKNNSPEEPKINK